MDVIGSFMTGDVFIAASSVLTPESMESVTFVDEWESSQWEVVTDCPGQEDFPSWQLFMVTCLTTGQSPSMQTACW